MESSKVVVQGWEKVWGFERTETSNRDGTIFLYSGSGWMKVCR